MPESGPIILIDDDEDEGEIIGTILKELNIPNKLLWFKNGVEALKYLVSNTEQPSMILSDINMPLMGGIELRKLIFEDENLRKKSIPFIFLTTTPSPQDVEHAYEMSVQGFFLKQQSMEDIKRLVKEVYEYWNKCIHPNKQA